MVKKYYLVTYSHYPRMGTPLYPIRSKMYEFDENKTPLECFEFINEDLNKHSCVITNMARVE